MDNTVNVRQFTCEYRLLPQSENCVSKIQAARAYGPLRAANRERNKNALDKLIASHALALSIGLVTRNEADFLNYPDLAVENWVNSH